MMRTMFRFLRAAACAALLLPAAAAAQPTFDRVTLPAGFSGDAKMVGDIDGDGRPDVAVAGLGAGEPLAWFRYPDWAKTVIDTSSQEYSNYGVIADVDLDGDNDIVVPDATISPSNVFWYENPGGAAASTGSLWVEHAVGHTESWCKDVAVFDYDADGRPDIAARAEGSVRPFKIFFQNAGGGFTRVSFSGVSAVSEGMWSADVDGDGDPDLVAQGTWLSNPGDAAARTPGSWTEYTIGTAPDDYKAFVADLTKDGVADVLYSNSEGAGDIAFWSTSEPRGGTWTKTTIDPSATAVHSLWAGDVDLDGDLDVVAASMDSHELSVYDNVDGVGGSWQKQVIDGASAILHNAQVADLGRDGDLDVFGAGWTGQSPTATVWLSELDPHFDLDSWTYIEVGSDHEQVFGLSFPDVDGDGLPDILSGQYWYENPGGDLTGTWTRHTLPQVGGNDPDALLATDVDLDLDLDVIAMSGVGGQVYWLERNHTSGAWTVISIGNTGTSNHGISSQGYRVADIEPGGRPEIVINQDPCYYFRVPANPQAGSWPRVTAIASSGTADEEVAVGDIDRDGLLDLVATNGDTGQVRWFVNPGNGAGNWTGFLIATLANVDFLDRAELADLDGDGKLDIVVSEENGSSSGAETWWLRQPADPTGTWPAQLIVSQGSTNSMRAADMDHDGDVDVVTGEHVGSLAVTVWENDGNGAFAPHTVGTGNESHFGTKPVDLDLDGDLDLVSIAWNAPQFLHLWRNDRSGGGQPTVATPTIAPPGGTFEGAVEVTLSTSTAGASLHYTVDGDDPTESDPLYTTPITLSEPFDATLKARGFRSGFLPSAVTAAAFVVVPDTTAPTIEAVSAVGDPTRVAVTFDEALDPATAGAASHYTIDHGIAVSAASLGGNGRTVTLTTSTLSEDVTYLLSVDGVEDLFGNAASDSASFEHVALPQAAALVSRWRLDETSGTTAVDDEGTQDGTLVNGPVWQPDGGRNGGALELDGVDDRVGLGTMDVPTGSGITLALGARADDFGNSDARLLSKATDTSSEGHYWMLSTFTGQALRVRLKVDGSTTTLVSPAGALVAGEWAHLAATYDGSMLRLYKDAQQIAATPLSGTVDTDSLVPAALGDQPQGGQAFDGLLDDVFVYNAALGPDDLELLMSLGVPPDPTIFADGFESGNTSAWSNTVP
ncbi:MAG: FG-GAP-like repeat-containing protein [Thermoanaerobaculia bacterium]